MHGINTNHLEPDSSLSKLFAAGTVGTLLCIVAITMPFAEGSPKLTNGLIGLFFSRGLLGQVVLTNGPIIFLTVFWINMPYFVLTGKYSAAIEDKRRAASQR